ncbi:MAG TPA: ABC transporter substrate-binding protein [Rhizobiaceae bacterium]|nr:ABC transporter substrate-binding protein [Rhizobiaceae bacterium]
MSRELDFLSRRVIAGQLNRRDFLGRAAALGVTATFANSLLSSAALAQTPVKGGLLKAGMVGGESTNTLDPALALTQVMFLFGKCWGEYLLAVNPDGSLRNCIAEDFGSSDDAKVWTFKIRQGVEFHNGKTVTAEDVVATLERHSDENSKSGALGVMRGIESLKASGNEVIVSLKDGNADLPYLMTDYHLIIQPNGGKDNAAEGVSAGPYKVSVNEPGVRHGGERFANYWDQENMGFVDQVEILVINDDTARMAALQGGQVDMINKVAPKVIELIKRAPGVTIQNASGPGQYVFVAHCNTAPFDNNDLRMALKLAIDRQEMVDKILMGYGSIGNDFPINNAYPLFADDVEQRTFDPEKAKFHYQKSGHSGPVVLQVSDAAFPGAIDAAQLYQQSAAKAGIQLEIKREPADGYWDEIWNKQPFCASYWGGRPTQDGMYSTAYLSTADWNDTRFKNEKFDQILIQARTETDQDKRKAMYRDMAVIVRDEGGLILPMFNDVIDATGPRVAGYKTGKTHELRDGYALNTCWVAG